VPITILDLRLFPPQTKKTMWKRKRRETKNPSGGFRERLWHGNDNTFPGSSRGNRCTAVETICCCPRLEARAPCADTFTVLFSFHCTPT
jgi:hypothetical protein